MKAGFDAGNGNTTIPDPNNPGQSKACPNISGKYTCYAIGGYVYIKDKSGKFLVGYIHLNEINESDWPAGKEVHRGDVLGTVNPDILPTTSGPHVHYQVLLGGANFPFASSVGNCSDGKLIPVELSQDLHVDAGPFECK